MLLHQLFVNIARARGAKFAFIDCNTGKRITYSKALLSALILSGKFGKFADDFIGIMIPTSAGCALSFLGVLMAGKTPVMINYSTGAEGNALYAQNKCGFKTIITSKSLLEKINCQFIDGMIFIEDIISGISTVDKVKAALLSKMPGALLLRSLHGGNPDDNIVILFTSGSEKEPKAVELTHRNIISNIEGFSRVVSLSGDDKMLATLPFFHVFGLTVNLCTPLFHGMTIIAYSNPLDYRTVCEIARDEGPTVMAGTPSFLRGYLKKSEYGDFKSLRIVVSGADKCPMTLLEDFLERHGIKIIEGYGTTETSPVISANTFENYRAGSVGKALPNVEIRIEDYETGSECPPGQTGRILVKGDLVMKGYLNDLEETSMRIRHGWYNTGDMGYVDEDGFLWHSGRLKRFVKIGGEMISLVKVEDVITKFLPPEVSCCVVEEPDALKGSKIVAAVTVQLDEKILIKQISEHLPNIALPRKFVVIDEMPRMGSGKIDFRAVAELVRTSTTGP